MFVLHFKGRTDSFDNVLQDQINVLALAAANAREEELPPFDFKSEDVLYRGEEIDNLIKLLSGRYEFSTVYISSPINMISGRELGILGFSITLCVDANRDGVCHFDRFSVRNAIAVAMVERMDGYFYLRVIPPREDVQ